MSVWRNNNRGALESPNGEFSFLHKFACGKSRCFPTFPGTTTAWRRCSRWWRRRSWRRSRRSSTRVAQAALRLAHPPKGNLWRLTQWPTGKTIFSSIILYEQNLVCFFKYAEYVFLKKPFLTFMREIVYFFLRKNNIFPDPSAPLPVECPSPRLSPPHPCSRVRKAPIIPKIYDWFYFFALSSGSELDLLSLLASISFLQVRSRRRRHQNDLQKNQANAAGWAKEANNLERKMGKEKQQQRDREKISRKKNLLGHTTVPPSQGDDLINGGKRKQIIEN